MKRIWALFLFILCLGASAALADEIIVNPADDGVYATITDALAAAQDGDVILIHGGTYTHDTEAFPLIVDKRVEITACEGEQVVLRGGRFQTIFRVTAEDVTLRGMDMELLRYGVLALADRLTVEDCSFNLYDTTYRVSSCGVWLAGAKHCRVAACEFIRCGLSMAGPPISESSAGKPVLTALFEIGEDKEFFTSHTVENNIVNGGPLYYYACEDLVVAPKDAGQLIAVDCRDVRIDGLNIAEGSMGLIAAHCDRVELTNTVADSCGLFGVYLAYIGGGRLENVVVSNTNHGIDMRVVQSLEVSNCHTVACDQGIFFSWAEECYATNCSAKDGKAGFFLACGDNNLLANCVMENNENALDVEKEWNLHVIDSTFRRNKVASVRLNDCTGVFANNLFEDNWVGFISYGGVPQTIYGNRFVRTGSCDLYLRNPVQCIIAGNLMEDSRRTSLQVEGTVEDSLFIGNLCSGDVIDHSGNTLRID